MKDAPPPRSSSVRSPRWIPLLVAGLALSLQDPETDPPAQEPPAAEPATQEPAAPDPAEPEPVPPTDAQSGEAPPPTAQDDAEALAEGQDKPRLDVDPNKPAPLDLTLEAALDLARASNLDIEIASISTEAARYDALGSWGAFEWVFDGRVTYTDGEFEPEIIFEGQGASVETESTTLGFDLTKPTKVGGRFVMSFSGEQQESTSGVQTFPESSTDIVTLSYVQPFRRGFGREYATSTQREFEILYRQQAERERQERQSVLLAVHNAYWDLVSAMQLRDVARSALELGNEQLEQNRRRLAAGVGTEVEVVQAQAEVATRIEALLESETAVHQAMDDLKRILFPRRGDAEPESWDADIVPITPLPEVDDAPELPSWHEALLVALESRPDLAQLRLEIDRARVRHARAMSERLAGIDLALSASGRGLDTQFEDAAGEAAAYEFPTYSATLSYNMPIGNKAADYAARRTRAEIRVALVSLERGETTAMAEVRRALRDVEYQAEAVRAAEQSLVLARRQLEAEQARYAADLSTNFQVLEFQQSLIEADANWRRARVAHAKALVALQQAQGLIDEDGATP